MDDLVERSIDEDRVEMDVDSHHEHVHVLNLDVITKCKEVGMKACCSWLMDVSRQLSGDVASAAAFQKSVKLCMKRNTGFLKSKNKPNGEEDLDRFLSSTFILPQKSLLPPAVRTPSSCHTHSVFDECGHENACHGIAKDLAVKAAQLEACSNDVQELREENVRLQVKAGEAETLQRTVHELHENLLSVAKELSSAEAEIGKLKLKCTSSATNLKRTSSREDYQRKKATMLESKERDSCNCSEYDVVVKDLQDMKQQLIIRDKSIDELKSTIQWLEDTLQDNQTLKTKDGKAYTTEMKVCVMELLDNNVSACRLE